MGRPYRTPGIRAVRVTVFVLPRTAETLKEKALKDGVPVGAVVDGLLAGKQAVKAPVRATVNDRVPPKPLAVKDVPVGRKHVFANKGYGTFCEVCRQNKNTATENCET